MISGTARDFSPQFNVTPVRSKAESWWPNKDARQSRSNNCGRTCLGQACGGLSRARRAPFSRRAAQGPKPMRTTDARPGAARSAPPIRSVPSQHGVRARIGFLQLHAPVFQFFKRDGRAGDCAPYKSPRLDDAEIPVEELDLRLPGHGRRSIKTIEHVRLLHNRCSKGIFSLEHGGNRPSRSTVRGTRLGGLARSVLTGPSAPQPQWPRWDMPAHIRSAIASWRHYRNSLNSGPGSGGKIPTAPVCVINACGAR
jgi:hypothetical protein